MLWRAVPLYPRKHASQTAARVPLARWDIALICASGGTVYTMVLEAIAERLESSNLSLRTNLNNVRFV